jgi:long-chain fatty acid transport protein
MQEDIGEGDMGMGKDARGLAALVSVSLAVILTLGFTSAVSAGGFLDQTQSAGAASVSTAGETAIAEDAATVYYNAAGMTLLDRPEVLNALGIVIPSSSFGNGGTTDLLGGPIHGSVGIKDQIFGAPSLFMTAPLDDRVHVGLGIFVPFGQINKYDENWVGRYQLQSISLKTIDIDPVISYRVTDTLSMGGGLDVQYAHLVRKNAIDFGSLCFVIVGPGTCPGLGLLPQGADGRLTADASDWSLGYNLSALYHPTDTTHIGFNYRSAVRHDFSGVARFDVPAAAGPLTSGGVLFQNTSAKSTVTFPDVISLGISQRINDRLTALLDVDGTLWSRVKQLTLRFGNPLQPTQSFPLNWHDSIRFAVGGIYHLDGNTDLRAGFSFDQSPIPDAFRSADLPDSDRATLSIGVMHRINNRVSTTISYSYDHYAAAPVNVSTPAAGALIGTFHRSSSAIGLQTRMTF